MSTLRIRTLGDPVLRERARPVERFDDALRRLADDMVETMHEANGVGLAAPQVGISSRFFVYDDHEDHAGFLANCEVVARSGEIVHDEGCLSIPGPFAPTARAEQVRVRGQDLEGAWVELEGEGLFARILQHETDHTDGMLYIDHLDAEARREVMRELRANEMGRATAADPSSGA